MNAYVPQFARESTPEGFVDEEFEYYYDSTNTPGLSALLPGSVVNKVQLPLQPDSEFIWRAIQISGDTGPLCLRFYDPFGNELSAVVVENDRSYSAFLQGPNPIGRLPVVFEPEIRCPRGGFLQLDIQIL
jgi:hypothetical protein